MDGLLPRTSFSVLRTLALAGAVGGSLAAAAPATAAPHNPIDTYTQTQTPAPNTYSFADGDGNVIVRHGDSGRLGRLVDKCEIAQGPADCRLVHQNVTPDGDRGYTVLVGKDIRTDHLTVPFAPITGVESPDLIKPGAENYFADAWKDGRASAAKDLGTTTDALPRDAIALAVNSQDGRSQDRLHIHADRLDPALAQQLKSENVSGDGWTDLKPIHGNHQYRAHWVAGTDLKANPFLIVHDQVVAEHGGGRVGEAYALKHMGQHSIAVVGETNAQGQAGFLILDGRYGQDSSLSGGPHNSGSAEEWLQGHADAPP